MTLMFVLVLCSLGGLPCKELGPAPGDPYVFESIGSCRHEIPFVKIEEKGRLSCQGRPFEFARGYASTAGAPIAGGLVK